MIVPTIAPSVKFIVVQPAKLAPPKDWSNIAVFKSLTSPLVDVSQNMSNKDSTGDVSNTAKFWIAIGATCGENKSRVSSASVWAWLTSTVKIPGL